VGPPLSPLHTVVTLARPPTSSSLKVTDRSFHYASHNHRVSGINSHYLFVNLILVQVPLFPTHPSLHLLLLPFLIYHSANLGYNPLSFTPGLKTTGFTNPSFVASLISPEPCLVRTILSYSVFVFSFPHFRFCAVCSIKPAMASAFERT